MTDKNEAEEMRKAWQKEVEQRRKALKDSYSGDQQELLRSLLEAEKERNRATKWIDWLKRKSKGHRGYPAPKKPRMP